MSFEFFVMCPSAQLRRHPLSNKSSAFLLIVKNLGNSAFGQVKSLKLVASIRAGAPFLNFFHPSF